MRWIGVVALGVLCLSSAACDERPCAAACADFQAKLDTLACGDKLDVPLSCATMGPCDCGESAYYDCLVTVVHCDDAGHLIGPKAGECDVLTCEAAGLPPLDTGE